MATAPEADALCRRIGHGKTRASHDGQLIRIAVEGGIGETRF